MVSNTQETKLSSPWTLYVDRAPDTWAPNMSSEDYAKNLRKIYTITTIEQFWQIFNNIPGPHMMPSKYSFHLMRGTTRRPIWEEPQNENGGCWKFKVSKGDASPAWFELLLAVVGEQFVGNVSKNDRVTGVSISMRDRDDQIQIWNERSEESAAATVMNKVLTEICGDIQFRASFYRAHQDKAAFRQPGYSYSRFTIA